MHVPYIRPIAILLGPLAIWAVIYLVAELTHFSLKPFKPALTVLCWIFWGANLIGEVTERPWRLISLVAYSALTLVLAWINRRYLFESNQKPARSLASVLSVPQPTYVAVKDVSATSPWYIEKFGLRKLAATEETRPDGVTLQFTAESSPIILVPRDPASPQKTPIFFTRSIGKARDRLMSQGVSVGVVQRDRQGTSFFELFDNEGNQLEVCERL